MAVLKVPGSIFDILGPVMTGPSSSHTAGAVRIGLMARGIAGGSPKKAVITFYGSLAETYKGHMTDSGVVAGLLGMGVDDPGIKEALESAKKKGISIQVLALPSETKNPNTIVVELETPEGRAYRVEGVTVGGGEIQISSIDNFLVDLRGKHDEVLLFTGPGTALPDEAKAIASGREPSVLEGPGGARLFVIRPFASPERSVLEGLGKANGALGVSFLPRLYDYGKADGPALFSTVEGMVRLSGEIGLLPALENYEAGRSGLSREEAREKLARAWSVMEGSTKAGLSGRNKMVGGFMPGDDGRRLLDALNSGVTLSGPVLPLAVAKAISAMEVNASMGRVCAAPAAGSCGVLPGVLSAMKEQRSLPDDTLVDALPAAGVYGALVAFRAPISGALGGCQSEIGVASAMAAAALAYIGGGSAEATAHAMALALKSLLGLVCDPVAGPVEIPCIKRNAVGVANAFTAADMALAGIRSVIPPDEVIDALVNVQQLLPVELRGSTQGSLGVTKTAIRLKEEWLSRCRHCKENCR